MLIKALSILFLLLTAFCLTACNQQQQNSFQGYIEGRYTYLASFTSGYLDELLVQRGNTVTKNQRLFVLNPNPEAYQLKNAEANLTAAKQNLINLVKGSRETVLRSLDAKLKQAISEYNLAKQDFPRKQKLYRQNAISKAEYDEAEKNIKVTENKVKEIESDIAEAKLGARENQILEQQQKVQAAEEEMHRLQWIVKQKQMNAPESGLIFDTFFRIGEFVNAGQAVLALLTKDNVHVLFFVPEYDLKRIKLGQPINFQCYNCKMEKATISYISPEAEYTPPVIYSEKTQTKLVFRVEATIDTLDSVNYHPGQPVKVTLQP